MICWSCDRGPGAGAFCAACGAIQPPDVAADHFRVLGVARSYDVEAADLERRYKELTKLFHPDRFARSDPRARRASLARSVALNQAWRTLADPVTRGEYLLRLGGIEVGGEQGTLRRSADGSAQRLSAAQELLLEVMELRETLAAARRNGDQTRIAAIELEVRGKRAGRLAEVAAGFAGPQPDLEAIARVLVAVRYYDRVLGEIAGAEEEDAPRSVGA